MRLSGALRNHIFNKYQMAMEKRPMLTQMITAGTLCAVGDIGNIISLIKCAMNILNLFLLINNHNRHRSIFDLGDF